MERYVVRSGEVDDVEKESLTDRSFQDMDMEKDGEDRLDIARKK